MKLCFIGKYPPIQGGVARDLFWTSLALTVQGHVAHVVTNAGEVEEYFRIVDLLGTTAPGAGPDEAAGGQPVLHSTTGVGSSSYIPWAEPFVSKLAGLALGVVEQHRCDLICGYYLEPYAVAAHLASLWSGVPFGVRLAGSDVGRLFLDPQLRPTYARVLQAADYVFATPSTLRGLLRLGVDLGRIYTVPPFGLPTRRFHPNAPALQIEAVLAAARDTLPPDYCGGVFHRDHRSPFDPTLPVIGIYGKLGESKGSYDLVRALGLLRQEGLAFNFLVMSQGSSSHMLHFRRALSEQSLTDVTWWLPFLPHWHVPGFIRTCTAVCFLERDFPIAIHRPLVPREVLACGTCLVLSREVAERHQAAASMRHGHNLLLVEPRDVSSLASVLRQVVRDPVASQAIGQRGYVELSAGTENFEAYGAALAATFERVHTETQERRRADRLVRLAADLRLALSSTPSSPDDQHPPLSSPAADPASNAAPGWLSKAAAHLGRARTAAKAPLWRRALREAYPLLGILGRHRLAERADRFGALYPEDGRGTTLDAVIAFGLDLEGWLPHQADWPAYSVDVARYERLLFTARFQPTAADALESINDPPADSSAGPTLESRPRLRDGVQLGIFEHDLPALVEALERGGSAPDPPRASCCLLIVPMRRSLDPAVWRVHSAMGVLTQLCDGARCVAELVPIVEGLLARANLTLTVLAMVRALDERGALQH